MAMRELVRIDEERCTGCGDCVGACAEGAIQIVEGKARLVSDIYCDGLGACLGHCPEDAISIERVEAKPFDHAAVERHLAEQREAPQPRPTPLPGMPLPMANPVPKAGSGSCPGSRAMSFAAPTQAPPATGVARPSELRQWPVQLHLVSPMAAYFQGADVLLAADCAAFAVGDFHRDHLRGQALAIACPKLDQGQEAYLEKLTSLIDDAQIRSLNVMVMEVPCCGGLLRLATMAAAKASREIPIRCVTVGVQGNVLGDQLVS